MEGRKRVIGYCRVSTDEQAKHGLSLAMQISKITAYAKVYDLGTPEIISDPGHSGRTLRRPGIQRVLELCRNDEVSAVIILKLDRLSRRTTDTLTLIDKVFSKGAISLHSICERLDTTTAAGRFAVTLMAALAQMEAEQIGERVKQVFEEKKAKGQYCGGQIPYGFKKNGKGLVPVPEEQETIALMQTLQSDGHSYRAIARELNARGIPSKGGKRWSNPVCKKIINRANGNGNPQSRGVLFSSDTAASVE